MFSILSHWYLIGFEASKLTRPKLEHNVERTAIKRERFWNS